MKKLIINVLSQDSITVTKTTLILTGKNQNYFKPEFSSFDIAG